MGTLSLLKQHFCIYVKVLYRCLLVFNFLKIMSFVVLCYYFFKLPQPPALGLALKILIHDLVTLQNSFGYLL